MGTSVQPDEDELDRALASIRAKKPEVAQPSIDDALASIRKDSAPATQTPPMRLRPVVATKPEAPPKPMIAAQPDVTRVGAEPIGLEEQLRNEHPTLLDATVQGVKGMVEHPIETGIALAKTPFKGGEAVGEYVKGGRLNKGKGRAAAIGAAQTGAMLLGGPAERLAEPVVARLAGEAAAPFIARTAVGAATGATFSPDRPAVGAIIGGAAGALSSRGVADARLAERQARFEELAKQHPDWFGEATPAAAESRASRILDNPNRVTAKATIAEPEPVQGEPDFTVDEPIIQQKGVFGGALEQHGKDFADGKVAPAVPEPTSPIHPKGEEAPAKPFVMPSTVEEIDDAMDANAARYSKATDPAERRHILDLQELLEDHRAAIAPPEPEHKFSSTQLDLPEESSAAVKELGAGIPDNALAPDGREDKPHITVKYGLHGEDPEAVRQLLANEPPITVKLGKTSFFPNGESENGDVVKVDVDSPELHKLNKKIASALPHTDTHPEYKPHVTIAYVRPGLGKRYEGNASLEGHTMTFDRLTFSGKGGEKHEVLLGGKAKPVVEKKLGKNVMRSPTWDDAKKDLTLDTTAEMDEVRSAARMAGFDGLVVNGEHIDLRKPKEPVHESARVPSGGLRDNFETVKDDGLIKEMFELLGAEDPSDSIRAIYRTVEADVSGTQFGVMIQAATRKGSGPSEQAKALHRMELKKGVAGRIERILNARGLTDEQITRRYAELVEIEAERAAEVEGLDNEERGDTSFEFGEEGYTNEHGEGAGRAVAEVEGAKPPAESGAGRSAAHAGPRAGKGTPTSEAEPSEVAPRESGAAMDDIVAKMRSSGGREPERNGYDQAVHDLWKEAGTNGRLELLDQWRRIYPEQDFFPEWADRAAEDLPQHVRDKIGMERVKQGIALKDIMSMLKTGEGTVGAQFDKSLFKKLGANLYKGDIPSVIVKEGIQNAFDSIRPLGAEGRIHVNIDPTTRTITISDNGHGMSPEVASNEFMDVGGSSKLEGSSGGFGLAKVGLLASAEHFSLVTIAEVKQKSGLLGREKTRRVVTTISGSADDWINGTLKFASEPLVDDSQGTGTRLAITVDKELDPQFYNAQSLLQQIMNAHHEAYQLTGTVRQKQYVPGYRERPATDTVEDKPVVATNRLELNRDGAIKESVAGADIEAVPTKEILENQGPFDSATEVHILNNGLYQFGSYKSLGTGAPRQLLINIKPTVAVDHPDYPFTTSREDLKGKAFEALAKIYRDMATAAGAAEIRDLIRALNAGIKIGSNGKTALYDTTYATPRAVLEELSKKPYVNEMADKLADMVAIIGKAIGTRLTFPDYHFGGLSTAGGYLGVNISRAMIADRARDLHIGYEGDRSNMVLLNPWQIFDEISQVAGTPRSPKQLFTDDEYAPVLAEQLYGTIVHEIAHQLARGHGEEFAGAQTRFDAAAVRVAPVVLNTLEDAWRVALQGGMRDDVNTLRVEAWGRGKSDLFKKFSGHLRPEPPAENPDRLPVGGDAAAAHVRSSEGDGGRGEGNGRRRLGVRPDVRGSEAGRSNEGSGSAEPVRRRRLGEKRPGEANPEGEGTDAVAVTAAAGRFNKVVDDVRKMFAPASRGPLAREAANITREQVARMAHENEIARHRLSEFAKAFSKLPRETRLDFIDRMENSRPQSNEQLSDAAYDIREMLDAARDAVRSLGTGHLENFIANYFPHIWSKPEEAGRIINQITGKRPLEGTRSFLKRRTIPTLKEGMELGLEPISTNPVDLSLLKIREMNRYIMGQRLMRALKDDKLVQFVDAFAKAPEGYARINDHVAMVYGPPTVPVAEAFDALVRKQLVDVMKSLGVEHMRPIKIKGLRSAGGGQVWGVAEGDKRIQAKFGGDATIIMHELGHILDHRYKLWDKLVERVAKRPNDKARLAKNRGKMVADQSHPSNSEAAKKRRTTIKKELRALADLRYEGDKPEDIAQGYKDYVREKPEQIANAVHAYIYAKAKMKRVAPTVYDVLDGIIQGDPKLKPLADIEPSVRLGSGTNETSAGGLVVKGQYWAPEQVANIINNYLSPGLRGNSIYDAYMGVGNLMNSAQLGLSAFHLGFTSMEASVSRVALSLRHLASGRPLSAARTFASSPAAPVTNFLRGRKLREAYLNPDRSNAEMTQIVDALVAGGGRIRMDDFYKTGAIEGLKHALDEHNPWGVAWRAFPALVELTVKPILEYVVPRQKMGVFFDHAKLEIEKLGKNPDPADVRRAMAEQWDSVDNRMGQLVYDNLFWNKVGKDLAMASVRAVGWNLGTIREIGGGLADFTTSYKRWKEGDEVFTTKMSYVVALPIFVGMVGALYTYLATGEPPKELKDYYFPRTGRIGPDGNPERVTLPSYIKDVYHYGKKPIHTIESKLHPAIEAIVEMLHNEDFYGTMIVDPDAPLPDKVKEYAKFMARTFTPFGIRNAIDAGSRGQSRTTQALNFIGITPAPRELVRTPAQNRMAEYLARHTPDTRTPAEADKGQMHRDVLKAVRAGDKLPVSVNEAMKEGKLKRSTLFDWIQDARTQASVAQFKRLSANEAKKVWQLASPAEKAMWTSAYRTKLVNAKK